MSDETSSSPVFLYTVGDWDELSQTYFTIHVEVPIDSSRSVQECISIIGDAAIHQALWV